MSPRIDNLGPHTWRDFTTRAAERLTKEPVAGADKGSTTHGESFSGTPDLRAAMKLAREGWQAGAKAIAKALDSLPPESQSLPDWQLEAAGAFPCVPAYLTGEPECMFRFNDGARSERRLAFVVPHSYGGGITPDEAQQYAMAVAALVRAAEASGIESAVYSMSCSAGKDYGYSVSCQLVTYSIAIREFGEPLDLAKVAFAFHPSFYRRVGFAWRERTPEAVAAGVASGGYGASGNTTLEHLRQCAKVGNVGEGSPVAILPPLREMEEKGLLTAHALPRLIEEMRAHVTKSITGIGAA